MSKLEELASVAKLNELLGKKEEPQKKNVMWQYVYWQW